MTAPSPQQPNTLGNTSLALGIASLSLVFGIGLCSLVGVQQGWIQVGGTTLFVCGASSAFLGLLGAVLGLISGLFGANRPRATAIIGLVLGVAGLRLFLAVLGAIQNAAGG
jgi:uncharacterized membrane protein